MKSDVHISRGTNHIVTGSFSGFVNEYFQEFKHVFLIVDDANHVPADIRTIDNVVVVSERGSIQHRRILKFLPNADLSSMLHNNHLLLALVLAFLLPVWLVCLGDSKSFAFGRPVGMT